MGTLVAVRCERSIALAADALNLVEELVHPNLNVASSCIVQFGDNLIGLNCSYALQQAIEGIISQLQFRTAPQLNSKVEVRKFFYGVRDLLRNHYQIVPMNSPSSPLESLPFNALVVNQVGIFKVDSVLAVYEFPKFWATGSGESFALGALHAKYDSGGVAAEIARVALGACGEFEGNRGRELTVESLPAWQSVPDSKKGSTISKSTTSAPDLTPKQDVAKRTRSKGKSKDSAEKSASRTSRKLRLAE